MAWVFLLIAGALEVTWAVGLKLSDGFTKLWPSVWTIAAMILSYVFLAQAVKSLPLGTAYAIWTGIGAVGAAVAGIFLFKEPASALRLVSISLIVAGIIGLRLATPA
ncbi:quaternary ammonium compound efflux SMR transporter SugE [Sphaerobacter thermophilus]|jgi:quaternary ammonium compound-resistance protein SugE|uniref:Guanidinium exporter n=1 Tax=Sphaerobacter thermophilus (strain ATCC 49802 / DSM 20745 / KCCM 41009 / NCIMB 13125 / S 6022) TaxID=479434 RepID=D1C1V0_SPHTD|nr:quaternary ammonium compound efflux SMR transporter SugE [Sphaerobacter thermophilus]ACZ38217.1 small multidrug resistance protein [Sphaerobacter thermophilus DSM 20745]PZN67590.1 MAG: quaternary ammonium compound-resistance protein SugE [Sphaerobacter thermophilus]